MVKYMDTYLEGHSPDYFNHTYCPNLASHQCYCDSGQTNTETLKEEPQKSFGHGSSFLLHPDHALTPAISNSMQIPVHAACQVKQSTQRFHAAALTMTRGSVTLQGENPGDTGDLCEQ